MIERIPVIWALISMMTVRLVFLISDIKLGMIAKDLSFTALIVGYYTT